MLSIISPNICYDQKCSESTVEKENMAKVSFPFKQTNTYIYRE